MGSFRCGIWCGGRSEFSLVPLLIKKMKVPQKVSRIPIERLWREGNWIEADRRRFLTPEEVKAYVSDPLIPIIVASISEPIHWVSKEERFERWSSISSFLLDGTRGRWETDFSQFFVASLWYLKEGEVILFEHYH